MNNNVTAVVLTVEIKNPPPSNLIKVEEVLVDGSGTLSEALQGGQAKYLLTLTEGKEVRKLTHHESVSVRGVRNGAPFRLDVELQTVHPTRPWTFAGHSGSTGPTGT